MSERKSACCPNDSLVLLSYKAHVQELFEVYDTLLEMPLRTIKSEVYDTPT